MAKIRQHPTEHQICATFMDMLNTAIATHQVNYPERFMCFHIPNGQRSGNKTQRVIAGGRDKRIGVRAGVADYFISYATAEFPDGQHIMFFEFKAKKGVLSAQQDHFAWQCHASGFRYYIPRSAKRAIEIMQERGIIKPSFRVM